TFYIAYKQNDNWVMNTENFTFRSDSPKDTIDFIGNSAEEIKNKTTNRYSRVQNIGKCIEIDDFKKYTHSVNSKHSNDKKAPSPFYNQESLNSVQIQQAVDILVSCNRYEKVIVWINPKNPTDVSILRVDKHVRNRNVEAEAIRNNNRYL
ncbi:MAG: hypothetical protein KUG73_12715, partial [Pseudomonadales bacterium]|nr:hypothetical protein [Pseudomonadales bacterium]